MQVFINGSPLTLFTGARVLDGLTAYSTIALKDVREGRVEVRDAEGHLVYVDGRLSDGDHLTLGAQVGGEEQ